MEQDELAAALHGLMPVLPVVSPAALAAIRAAAEQQPPPPSAPRDIEVHPHFRLPDDPEREQNRRRLQEYLAQMVEAQLRAEAHAASALMREVYRNVDL